ncbi:aldo/keto reductase [Salinicoccus kekensis]|uniref:Diketogulonate reductase-like aldo/keto reductase n=1 Tax=Salinicoccus kekensis TaxID=714307 RepID=A0A285ULJ8_9STAP|nr:aldo/keto reductase [Salinicoccus kekensis]SOC42794.1 diketogulonate reductase-like aldo/keto reductase [Salinicoccus kekensis]
MAKSIQDTYTLSNGVEIPVMGLGVYKNVDEGELATAVTSALEFGYRHIDTAKVYKNEKGVGEAIKNSGVPREDIFVTTKVWNTDQGYEKTLKAFDKSLEALDMDYIDLYLIHWPMPGTYVDTWKALEKLYKDGKVRAIGVSNFNPHHLQDIFDECEIKPMLNQVEYHPHLAQPELKKFCESHGILLEAWSPLKRGRMFDEPLIVRLAEKYGKTPAQIILRWDVETGVSTIPKSVSRDRVRENGDIFDFELTPEEVSEITALDRHERVGKDPDKVTLETFGD